jgi:hypothetical protein
MICMHYKIALGMLPESAVVKDIFIDIGQNRAGRKTVEE